MACRIILYILFMCFSWTISQASSSSSPLYSSVEGMMEGVWQDNEDGVECSYLYNDEVLFISGFEVSSKIEDFAKKHPDIKTLSLYHCGEIKDSDIGSLAFFRHLKYLKLVGGGISDTHIKLLGHSLIASRLVMLELEDHSITDNGVKHIVESDQFSNLKILVLINEPSVKNISNKSIEILINSSLGQNLVELCLSVERIDLATFSPDSFKILKTKCVLYADLYSIIEPLMKKYLRYEPGSHKYIWRSFKGKWYLCDYSWPKVTNTLMAVSDKLLELEIDGGNSKILQFTGEH